MLTFGGTKMFARLKEKLAYDWEMSKAIAGHTGNKGQLGGLTAMAMSVVVFVVVVVAGSLILAEFAQNSTVKADAGNVSYNASAIVATGKAGLGDLVGWLGLIIIIVIAVMILGYFGLRTKGKGGA